MNIRKPFFTFLACARYHKPHAPRICTNSSVFTRPLQPQCQCGAHFNHEAATAHAGTPENMSKVAPPSSTVKSMSAPSPSKLAPSPTCKP